MPHSRLFLSLLFLAACAPADESRPLAQDPQSWWSVVGPRLAADSRRFHAEGEALVARHPASAAEIRPGVTTLSAPGATTLSLSAGGGRPTLGACQHDGAVDASGHCLQRAEIDHGHGLVEWWASTAEGLEQGFELARAEGDEVRIAVATDVAISLDGDKLRLGDWTASALAAWDADGRALPVRFVAGRDGFELVARVEGARFPVTIDPLYRPDGHEWTGSESGEGFGTAIASGGDVNGDGYDDLAVGAPSSSGGGNVYVFHGSADGVSTTATTSIGNPNGGAAQFGAALSIAGDLDGDGYNELVVGSPGYDGDSGILTVYEGGSGGVATSATADATLDLGSRWGASIVGMGDVNGDGRDDFAVGGPGDNGNNGVVYLLGGASSGFSVLGSAAGTTADEFGTSLAAGDFNGDGYTELVVSAPGGTEAFIYDGSTGAGMLATTPGTLVSTNAMSGLGAALAVIDYDDDGDLDLAVGTYDTTNTDGRVSVYLSDGAGLSNITDYNYGGSTGAELGRALASPGDLDADGVDDLVVGAPGLDFTYVFSGDTDGTGNIGIAVTLSGDAGTGYGGAVAAAGDVDADGFPDAFVGAAGSDTVTLLRGGAFDAMATGPAGETILGDTTSNRLGMYLDFAGDIDNDGYDDLVVAAPVNDYAASNAGAVYTFHGSATGLVTTADVSLYGEATDDRFGGAVAGAGDVNSDGYADVIVGSPTHDTAGANAGRVYLYEGSASGLGSSAATTIDGESAGEQFGSAVAGGGQIYRAGYGDVAVGAPYATGSGGGACGEVRTYRGSATGLSTTASDTLSGEASGDYFGLSVALVDVTHDYYYEVVAGAPNADPGGLSNAGSIYAFTAQESGLEDTASISSDGAAAGDGLGRKLSRAGDVNGDGYGDVLATAIGASSNAGAGYLFLGTSSGLDSTASWSATGDASNDYLGSSVGAGDFNGDGLDEPALGAYASDDPVGDAGSIYVYTLADDLDEIAEQRLLGEDGGDYLGFALAAGGDINGDGYDDLVGGAFSVDDAANEGGAIYTWYGEPADIDGDGTLSADDCDDGDASVGEASLVFYRDIDSDGYGYTADSTTVCRTPYGNYSTVGGDCSPNRSEVNPAATEVCDDDDTDEDCSGAADNDDPSATGTSTFFADNDGDGYGDAANTVSACDQPTGYVSDDTDCNDADAAISPAGTEACDALDTDEDCDGLVNDDDPSVTGTSPYYDDEDADGYGESAVYGYACDVPGGYVLDNTDCLDTDYDINPSATELCDGSATDEDCDGLADMDDPDVVGSITIYADVDDDGYGDASEAVAACGVLSGHVTDSTDCDDENAAINPGATEACDDLDTDEDCDGLADDVDGSVTGQVAIYNDFDGDGYGGSYEDVSCETQAGEATNADDCDDRDASINPDGTEVCDALDADEDCDGLADDDDPSADSATFTTWFSDDDGDGYGDATGDTTACDAPAGHVADDGDCDDLAEDIHPGADESDCTDPIDYNCDGSTGYADDDSDGWAACEDCDDDEASAYPGGTEMPVDGIDGDCDGYEACYIDGDGDGYRADETTTRGSLSCTATGEASAGTDSGDCDDADASVSPAATETTGDEVDQDCDGVESCYADDDGDSYHDGATTVESTDADCGDVGEALAANTGDCDSARSDVFPGADESDCTDPTDYNCDGSTGYTDADSDGYAACAECDDTDAAVSPAATESCNGVDDDCDGSTDPDTAIDAGTWYADADADGFTDAASSLVACDEPAGYAAASSPEDCDDADATSFPGARELSDDGIDQDCDGSDLVSSVDTGDSGDTGAGDTADSGRPDTGSEDSAADDTGGGSDSGDTDTDTDADTDADTDVDTGTDKSGESCGCDAGSALGAPATLLGALWLRRRRASRRRE